MNTQNVYILEDRGILYINGADAKEFLQNLISNDINKVDEKRGSITNNREWFEMSVKTGEGLGLILDKIGFVGKAKMSNQNPSIITQSRHRTAINVCISSLCEAKRGLSDGRGLELVAEDLRSAAHALGRITGRVDVEDLLDIIFKEFCIGK